MDNLIDLVAADPTEEQKRQYILDRVGPRGVDYVVDFNVNWTDPGGDDARQWRQTFETLASTAEPGGRVRRCATSSAIRSST